MSNEKREKIEEGQRGIQGRRQVSLHGVPFGSARKEGMPHLREGDRLGPDKIRNSDFLKEVFGFQPSNLIAFLGDRVTCLASPGLAGPYTAGLPVLR